MLPSSALCRLDCIFPNLRGAQLSCDDRALALHTMSSSSSRQAPGLRDRLSERSGTARYDELVVVGCRRIPHKDLDPLLYGDVRLSHYSIHGCVGLQTVSLLLLQYPFRVQIAAA